MCIQLGTNETIIGSIFKEITCKIWENLCQILSFYTKTLARAEIINHTTQDRAPVTKTHTPKVILFTEIIAMNILMHHSQ